jgi:hypothetical protein
MKNEEKMSYEELAIDAHRMRTARDSLMLSNANLKVENYELKQAQAKPWVGLTDGVMCDIAIEHGLMSIDWIDFARAIEQALKEKNFD